MSSLVFEKSLAHTEGYDTIRKGENVPLRDLDNFVFYTKRKKGTKLVSIEDIEVGEPIYGRGRLMPKKGANKLLRAIEIELDILDSWALEFCDKLAESGVWIKTNYGWYRLLRPSAEYKYLYDDLHSRFEITLNVFAVLIGPNGSNMVFKDMARKLKELHGITDKQLIDNAVFIARHLRSVANLDRIGFIRSLEITHAFFNKGLYKLGSAYTSKVKKRKFNEIKHNSSRASRSNAEPDKKHADDNSDSDVEEHSVTKRRKITHHTNNTPTNNLFVTKSRQYNGVKDYSTIPQRYLSEDKRSLRCFVCDQTMRVEDIEQYLKHITKHRSNLVGEMLDKDRVAFRLQSFINQSRVRNFIETNLGGTDELPSAENSTPLADLPSHVNMTMKTRKRRNYYADEQHPTQMFESEHQPLYNEVHREEEIEEMIVDSTNYKTVPTSNRYGDVSEVQEFEEEIVDEAYDEPVYVPYSRDDDDDDNEEDDEDEDFNFKPKTKPKPKRRSGTRTAQRRFASAQQLEKERQRREQKENNRAIQALEVLVAREILDAVETMPALEPNRETKLRQDLSMLLLPAIVLGNVSNEGEQNTSEIESNSSSLDPTNDGIKSKTNNNSPNIALCTANEVMVKQ